MCNATLSNFRVTIVPVKIALTITYSDSVSVALDIRHAMRMRHIVICGLSGSTVFFYIISQMARISKRVIERKMCILIFSAMFI